jgi:hypothetical protein
MSGPPSTRTIQIHAFRYKHDDAADELPEHYERLRFGHVGISVGGENSIYGFTPVRPVDISRKAFVRRLIRERECFPGKFMDDAIVFNIAAGLYGRPGEDTIKVKHISESSFLEVETRVKAIANSLLANVRYSLPPKKRGQRWERGCYNCATFLGTLADFLNIYPSGRLGDSDMDRGTYAITIFECR